MKSKREEKNKKKNKKILYDENLIDGNPKDKKQT